MLNTLLHIARSKDQLAYEQHQFPLEELLLHLGANLRPQYVIGEEAEAEKSEPSVCMVYQCVAYQRPAYQCMAYQHMAYQHMAYQLMA